MSTVDVPREWGVVSTPDDEVVALFPTREAAEAAIASLNGQDRYAIEFQREGHCVNCGAPGATGYDVIAGRCQSCPDS